MATESRNSVDGRQGLEKPAFSQAVTRQVHKLGRLQPDWDAYGALAIDPAVIEAACQFVRALPDEPLPPPRVVPLSGGNLQFEWHRGPKILELEFETDQTIRYLQWDPEAKIEEESVFPAADVDSAVALILWFQAGAAP